MLSLVAVRNCVTVRATKLVERRLDGLSPAGCETGVISELLKACLGTGGENGRLEIAVLW